MIWAHLKCLNRLTNDFGFYSRELQLHMCFPLPTLPPTSYSSCWAIKWDSVPLFLQCLNSEFLLDIEAHWRFNSRCYHNNCQWKQRESMNSQNAVLRPCWRIKGIKKGIKLLLPMISRWILRPHECEYLGAWIYQGLCAHIDKHFAQCILSLLDTKPGV